MKRIATFALLFIVTNCFGQSSLFGAKREGFSGGSAAAVVPCGFACTSNPDFIWTNTSLAQGNVTTWVDGVAGKVATTKVASSTHFPTNNLSANGGVWFNGDGQCAMTNVAITMASGANWTIAWVVTCAGVSEGSIGGDNAATTGFYLVNNSLDVFFSGTTHTMAALTGNTRYAMMASHTAAGVLTVSTNGVTLGTVSGMPTFSLETIGDDSGDPFTGYIQKMIVWTNSAKSLTDAASWTTYSAAHNP